MSKGLVSRAWLDHRTVGQTRLLLMVMADNADDATGKGETEPGRLRDQAGLSAKAFWSALTQLQAQGIAEVAGWRPDQDTRPIRYTLRLREA